MAIQKIKVKITMEKEAYLVLAMSTGIEAAVVIRPEIMEAQK